MISSSLNKIIIQPESESSNFCSYEDKRGWFETIKHIVTAAFHEVKHHQTRHLKTDELLKNLQIMPSPICTSEEACFEISEKELPWHQDQESNGLYLFISGLDGSPDDWTRYVDELHPKSPGFHFLVPTVPLKGNCPLEVAAMPFLSAVTHYLQQFPGKPLYICCESNGTRIASYIETKLDPELLKISSLSIASIAGIYGGSNMISVAKKLGLLKSLDPTLLKELNFGSETSTTLLQDLRIKQLTWDSKNISVRHLFIATTEDTAVRPITSSLPQLGDHSHYCVIHGETHMTIGDAVQNIVIPWFQN